MAALKDAYLNQIYKKADETVANERTVPARFVFPQSTSNDPFRTIALSKWANYIGRSMQRYRHDKNAIMPVPFPVGVAEIGGDAQRLFTSNIRELTIKEIIGSTGVPEGFLGDGMTWSGGSVQLRMLENMIMSYLRALNRLVGFIAKEVAKITDLPEVDVRFKPFRMSDDVQMLQMLIQLAQMKHVSFKEILDRMDLDWSEQHEIIEEETEKVQDLMVQESLTEAKSMLKAMDWQVEAQSRQGSKQQMLQELNTHSESLQAQLTRQATYDQAEQQEAEQIAEQQENSTDPEEAEAKLMEAKAENLQAEAEKDDTLSDIRQQSYQIAPVVEGLVKKLITMSPQKREQKIDQIAEAAPRIAHQVQERLSELTTQESQNEAGSDLVSELRANSKNPKEMAERILMLPPELKGQAFEQLTKEDPQLAMMVARELKLVNSGNKGQSSSGADTREAPKAKPPRRK